MKRPLVPVALLYTGGIILADFAHAPLAVWLTGALLFAWTALVWAAARRLLLVPLLVLLGGSNLEFRTAIISRNDLRILMGEKPAYLTLRGILIETPTQRVYEHDAKETWRTVAKIQAESLRFPQGERRPAVGLVAVSTPGVLSNNFFAGQVVEVTGILQVPKGPLAEGLFDYRSYLRRLGIAYQLQVESLPDWLLVSGTNAPPPLADRFGAWAKKILALGLPVEDEPLRLLWAMTLGWQTALNGEVAEPFMRSGTMHIFAISGLHIVLIAGILVSLLRVVNVPRGACGLVVIPLIWFYTAVTGWQASAIRSTIMMTVIIGGWSLKRPSNLLNSLAAAAFIILVWDPQQLFQASFQLSFFVVLSLALFTPALERVRRRLFQRDPLVPADLRPRWQRSLDPALRHVTASLVTSLAAWLGSIPLVAFYFHFFTPVSLLANLIVVPLSSLALMTNLASLVVGGWFPAGAVLFNHSAWFFMLCMVRVSEWAARLPGGCFNVPAPTLLTFVFYYSLLIGLLAGWLTRPRLRFWVMAALLLLGLARFVEWRHERSATRLVVLPRLIFLDAPGRKNDWLVNCGDAANGEFVTKPFLRAQGVNRLPHFLLTHGEVRRFGGAAIVEQGYSPKQVYLSPVRSRSPAYREVVAEFGRRPGRTRLLQRGDRAGPWTVLHPEGSDHFPQAGDNALVLRGDFNGTRVLLVSDLGKPGQSALMQRNADLRADIVVSGIPHQTEPLADALIEAIRPRLIIIEDAAYPATERASRVLRERLDKQAVPILYTREAGAITVSFRNDGYHVRRMTPMSNTAKRADPDLTPDESTEPPRDAPEE